MSGKQEVIKAVKAAFDHEPRINLHRCPVHIDFEDGVLTLEGEVENVAAKKLAMELGIAVFGVTGIVDRRRITPPVPPTTLHSWPPPTFLKLAFPNPNLNLVDFLISSFSLGITPASLSYWQIPAVGNNPSGVSRSLLSIS